MPRRGALVDLLLLASAEALFQLHHGLLQAAGGPPSEDQVRQAIVLMREEPDSPVSLASACADIGARGFADSSKDWMYDAGALEPILAALRRFPDDRNLQFSCCQAAGGMSLYNKRTMEAAGKDGAVELVLGAMKRWPQDPEMQLGGLQGCFMDFSAANRLRWQQAGGIEANLQSIRNHYNNSAVVLQACYAFSSGTQEPNTEAFVKAGAIDLLVQVMRDHPTGFRVREEIMQAMKAVGSNPQTRPALARTSYAREVVAAMRDAPMDFHQQSPGCANVAILAASNATLRAQFVEAGAPEAALAALRAFPEMLRHRQVDWPEAYDKQYTVYEDCTEALAALSSDAEARARLKKAGASEEVAGMMRLLPENLRVQAAGAALLKALEA